ncbi:MAG: peptide ABC transporter substrate-binding protein [Chloroflexi bacterium]|nr:peptide ABC transporter substrate-binding protein [Chloroflexota bacterium]
MRARRRSSRAPWLLLAAVVLLLVGGAALVYARSGGSVSPDVGLIVPTAVLPAIPAPLRPLFETATVEVPAPGGVYIEATVGRPNLINPVLARSAGVERDLAVLVFSGLTKLDPRGEIVPDLASRIEPAADGRSYTAVLRSDARWHDGRPVTPADVVFTFRFIRHAQFPGDPNLATFWRTVRLEEAGADTVRFHLNQPYAPFPEQLTIGLLPAHILGSVPPAELARHAFNASPIGTGPFRVRSASVQQIELEAVTGADGRQPLLEKIVLRFFPTDRAALSALTDGSIQGVRSVPSSELANLTSSSRVKQHGATDYTKTITLLLNLERDLFKDKTVRQAIAEAVDRTKVIQTTLQGNGEPATGPIPASSWAYQQQSAERRLDRARELLERANWRVGANGRTRERDGKPLRFTLVTNDRSEREDVVRELAGELSEAGFEVETRVLPWETLYRDHLAARSFDAALVEQWLPVVDPDPYAFWHSTQIREGLNFGGWNNPRADELLVAGRAALNRPDRQRAYEQIQVLFADERPAVPLYHPRYTFAVDANLKGITIPALFEPADRFRNFADWYLNTQRVPKKDS